MKIVHKGIVVCSECGTILSEDYNFKHKVLSNKEFESIIGNARKSRPALIKLISVIVFVLEGNLIIIKNKNGQNNTGVFGTSTTEKSLNEIKDKFRVGKAVTVVDWVNGISDDSLLAMITDELYDFANYSGYMKKLYNA